MFYVAKEAEEDLKKSIENSPLIDIEGHSYFVHPLCDGVGGINHYSLNDAAQLIMTDMVNRGLEFNKLLTVEAMGIPITTAVSLYTKTPFVITRKRKYELPGEVEISQDKIYESNKLYLNGIYKGDKVIIIDDVCDTGNTLSALIDAVQLIGAEVVACYVIVDFDRAVSQFPDSKALVSINIDSGKVVVL